MSKRKNVDWFLIIFCVMLFLFGTFTGASNFSSIVTDVKWTDIVTTITTFLGFSFAYYNYVQWLKIKRNDDSYSAAKRYLSAFDDIEENLEALKNQFDIACPRPGGVAESKETSIQRLIHIKTILDGFYQSRVRLIKANRDLKLWDVELSAALKSLHKSLRVETDNVSFVTDILINQLYQYHLDGSQNIRTVMELTEQFDNTLEKLRLIILDKSELTFDFMFHFNAKN